MKRKRRTIFQIFIWGSALHLPLLILALRYGYTPIHFGWLVVLYVFVFRYFNHRYFNVHWMLKYLDDEISTQGKRVERMFLWSIESKKDSDKLEALRELWELDDLDAVRDRIEEDLEIANKRLLELKKKHDEVLDLKEQTFAEYARTHLWH